jgi:hypothetical protein
LHDVARVAQRNKFQLMDSATYKISVAAPDTRSQKAINFDNHPGSFFR